VAFLLRALTADDAPQITGLNNAAVPAVPEMTEEDLDALREMADVALAVIDEERPQQVLGFVLAMHPGSPYDSENYRWFEERGGNGLYVDRIVVDGAVRGRGLGQVLYASVFGAAEAEGRSEVTCEVNVEPPNPGSLAFHSRLGFAEVGRQATKGGTVVVALLAAPLPQARRELAGD
jgi:predicted GNAT superfamily acetyltransferase